MADTPSPAPIPSPLPSAAAAGRAAPLPETPLDNPEHQPVAPDPYVRGMWYVAMPASALRRGAMRAQTILGEPVLFARRRDGSVFAIRDLCPHRGIPLRFGRFDGETVQCGYHGWRFDGAGQCTEIPSLIASQQVDLGRIRCGAYRAAELQGLIWIFMPDPAVAADRTPPLPEPLPDFGSDAPRAAVTLLYESDYDNAAFGMMDPAHIPFVHRAWWLSRSAARLRDKEKHFEPAERGWRMATHPIRNVTPFHRLLGRRVETEITLALPGLRIERIFGERHRILNLLAITPIDAKRTQMLQAIWWSMPGLGWLAPVVRAGARQFLAQDGDIIVKQNVGLAHDPGQMLVADADAQMRWWLRLKDEWRAHRHEGRPFRNPVAPRTLRFRS
ncbi:MAG: Rieske 2Fe-2S domain-containing protein [Pseudomonadota bacterium]